MDAVTLVAFIASMFVAGRIAERRGRSFKTWAWIAAFIGPLALPWSSCFRTCAARTSIMPEASSKTTSIALSSNKEAADWSDLEGFSG